MKSATRIFVLALAGLILCMPSVEAKDKKEKKKKQEHTAKAPTPILEDGETIVASMYTVHRGVMKMTVVMDFESETRAENVALELSREGQWEKVLESPIITDGYTAHFRVEDWNASRDVSYRVVHGDSVWEGTIRRDPIDKETIVVAGFTGNAGGNDKEDIVAHVRKHEPDLLVFTGDQVYGSDHRLKFPTTFCLPFRDLLRN